MESYHASLPVGMGMLEMNGGTLEKREGLRDRLESLRVFEEEVSSGSLYGWLASSLGDITSPA